MKILNIIKISSKNTRRVYIWKILYTKKIYQRKKLFFNETSKEKVLLLPTTKLIKNDLGNNAKEYYKSFLKAKNKKIAERSKLITQ